MAKTHKLTKGGQTIYPATIYDAVVNPNNRKNLTTEISELENEEIYLKTQIEGSIDKELITENTVWIDGTWDWETNSSAGNSIQKQNYKHTKLTDVGYYDTLKMSGLSEKVDASDIFPSISIYSGSEQIEYLRGSSAVINMDKYSDRSNINIIIQAKQDNSIIPSVIANSKAKVVKPEELIPIQSSLKKIEGSETDVVDALVWNKKRWETGTNQPNGGELQYNATQKIWYARIDISEYDSIICDGLLNGSSISTSASTLNGICIYGDNILIKGIKEITELQNKYNAEKSYQNELLQKQVELENELRDIESKRDIAKANGDDTTNFENQIVDIQNLIKDNDNSIANSSAKLQGMSTQMGKMTQGAGAVIGIIDKIVKGIDDSIQATADLFNEIKDIASSYGVDTESGGWQDLSIAMSSLSEMSTNVSNSWNSFKSGDFAGAAVSAIKSVGSVIKGINAIHDAKYERKIKRQQKNIESLQDAYEILKEKIDKAWDITSLNNATKQTTQNIDQQIRSYQEMINAEQKKKDTDDERIKEWNEAIKELQKTKEEIIKQEQMDLGGIGGESEYRDAAESFVQAWMDAFNETEDGLKALNENFNDFIENLIVKQATMRLAQARLKKLFDMIDKSVTEDSDGGISITQKELADIYAEATTSMKGLNEDLLSFVETLGYKPSKKANLSALTQGITQISEETANELSAILNSVRFFVANQTSDITAIRNILETEFLSSGDGSSNPMLIELKSQTECLKLMSDNFESILSYSGNSKGRGIRVFIQ